MGYGFPAALAAALVHRERRVVALLGDGGMGMTLAEVETAVREGAHVVAIVFDNERYGMIRAHQDRQGSPSAPGTDLGPLDFAAAARACGARGVRVDGDAAFESALRTALAASGPTVIQVALDRRWVSVDQPATAAGGVTPPDAPPRPGGGLGRPGPGCAVPARPRTREDGFVHCTDGDEAMVAVANRFYRDDPRPFLLLTLDLERTGSPWRFDDPCRDLPARLRADRPVLRHRGPPDGPRRRRRVPAGRGAARPVSSGRRPGGGPPARRLARQQDERRARPRAP